MLVLSRGPEEAIVIGQEVEVRVLEIHGERVRLGIVAPPEVSVHRKEVFLSIQRENRAASSPEASGLDRALELVGGTASSSRNCPEGAKISGAPRMEPAPGAGSRSSPHRVRGTGGSAASEGA